MENQPKCKNRMCGFRESCEVRGDFAGQVDHGGFPNADLARKNISSQGNGPFFMERNWNNICTNYSASAERNDCPEQPQLEADIIRSKADSTKQVK